MKHRPIMALAGVFATGATLAAPPIDPNATVNTTVAREVHHDTSRPLREILAELGPAGPVTAPRTSPFVPNIILDATELGIKPSTAGTPGVQRTRGTPAPSTIVSFTGMAQTGGIFPPDTTGDVSPAHYFQWVNVRWTLFDKVTGLAVPGGTGNGNSFFAGFGGLCQSTNNGDPLVLWDDAAQRWIVSQFAFSSTTAPPFLQCVAVSATSDPLGAYHRYAFQYPAFNDYGKMGVWRTADGGQNAYLFTMHEFAGNPLSFQGASFAAVERDKMLAGQSAQFLRVGGINAFGALPFHMEGTASLPAGSCPVFAHFSFAGDGYRTWDFCVNWGGGAGSVVGFNPEPVLVRGAPFVAGTNNVPQRDTTNVLDPFAGNSMYLAALRAFPSTGPNEAVAAMSHSVNVGDGQAGQKWVQFGMQLDTSDILLQSAFEDAAPVRRLSKRITQEGTYSPDSNYRWMSAINIDQNGNLGIGYNVSGTTLNPEIRINGRTSTDPDNTLREEQNCTPTNTGAQTGATQQGRVASRWGDYSTTGVDPADDCTFWHTGEFYPTTAASAWRTRVCSFKFDSCGQPQLVMELNPVGRLPVCSASTSDPTVNVRAAALGGLTGNTVLSASGFPAGVVPTFLPPTVPAGGTSVATLVGSRLLAPGLYSGSITGTNGAASDSAVLDFGVSAAAAGAPTLSVPANGATGASIRPTLSWGAVTGANQYRVELSLSSTFATLIETGVSNTNSYVPNTLLTVGVQYFWRVRSLNFCGDGALSATFSFTTGAPGVCPSGTTPNIVFQDDVSGDAIAWTTENVSGDVATQWAKTTPPAGTGLTTRAWVAGNSATTGDQRLATPTITLPATAQRPLSLAFDAHHQYEVDGATGCWDGGFVEISTDGGTNWVALDNSRTLRDPYPGTLSSGNPAAGNFAWCRQPTPGTPIRTVFNLDGFDGQNVRFRFRSTSDSNTIGPAPAGWSIDNFTVQGCAP